MASQGLLGARGYEFKEMTHPKSPKSMCIGSDSIFPKTWDVHQSQLKKLGKKFMRGYLMLLSKISIHKARIGSDM
jgi:hypothetical protein